MHKQLAYKHLSFSFLLIVLLLLQSIDTSGQQWRRNRNQVFVGLGASGFMGDLGGANDPGGLWLRDFDFAAVRPAMTFGYRYMLNRNFGISANLAFGLISGNDRHTLEEYRNNRNIHFRSPLIEVGANAQFHFWEIRHRPARRGPVGRGRRLQIMDFTFYGFTGVGGVYFNPQGYFDREAYTGSIPVDQLPENGWYSLRRLNTEGQGFFPTRQSYSPVTLFIPVGLGVMIRPNPDFSIGVEYGLRTTFTDYIDDVSTTYVDPQIFSQMFDDPSMIARAEFFANPTRNSLDPIVTAPGQQRGNPFSNDSYMFTFIKLYYRILPSRPARGLPRF